MSIHDALGRQITSSMQSVARTLDVGADAYANAELDLKSVNSQELYEQSIIEGKLIWEFMRRSHVKPKAPKWWTYFLTKKAVRAELKSNGSALLQGRAKFPKLYQLETSYVDTVFSLVLQAEEEKANEKASTQTDSHEAGISEVPPEISESESDLPENLAEVSPERDDAPEEDNIAEAASEELTALLATIAQLEEENKALRDELTDSSVKIADLHTSLADLREVIEQQAAAQVAAEAQNAEHVEDATLLSHSSEDPNESGGGEPLVTDEHSNPKSEEDDIARTDSEVEPVGGPTEKQPLPKRANAGSSRTEMPSFDNIMQDVVRSDDTIISTGESVLTEESELESQEAESDLSTSTEDEVPESYLEEADSTLEEQDEFLSGLIEPPEDGFAYEDELVEQLEDNPFVEAPTSGDDALSSGRNIVVEKLVVQQQVTEQSTVQQTPAYTEPGDSTGVAPSLPQRPQLPAVAPAAQDSVAPVAPVAPVASPEYQQGTQSTVPQRPALPVYEAPVLGPEQVSAKPTEDQKVEAPPVVAPASAKETETDSTVDSANNEPKEYQPTARASAPAEPAVEKQMVHADMEVTADSVNINTKSGDPLADFDPSKYLNLANTLKKDEEAEVIEEETPENSSEVASETESSSSFYEDDEPSLPMDETARVSAMLKELRQLRGTSGIF